MPLQNYNDPLGMEDLYEQEVQDNLDTGTIGRSFESGLHGMASSTNAAAAAVARILGADKYAKGREQVAREQATRAAGSAEGVTKFGEIDSAGDLGDWALGAFVSNAPLLGTMALTGGAGGIAGAAMRSRAGQAAAARKAAEREVSKQLRAMTPGMSRKAAMTASQALGVGEKAAEQVMHRTHLRNAVSQGLTGTGRAATIGRRVGTAAPYGLMTTGETYMGILNDPNASGTEKEQALAAIMSGGAQATLGMAFEPVGVMQRAARLGRASRTAAQHARREVTMRGGTVAEGVAAARRAKDASKLAPLSLFATTTLGEGATEAGEQAIQQFTQNQFNPEAGYNLSELAEAAAAGMVVGGGMAAPGAMMAAIQNRRADRGEAPPVNPDGTMRQPLHDSFENLDLPVKGESIGEEGVDGTKFTYGPPDKQIPGYVTLKYGRTGDIVHIPDNIEALLRKAPVYLNGVPVATRKLKLAMENAIQFKEALEPEDVFDAIQQGGQYAPVERNVQVVEIATVPVQVQDERGQVRTVDRPVVVANEEQKITTRSRPMLEQFGLSIAKIKPVGTKTQTGARRSVQKWLNNYEEAKKKRPGLTLTEYLDKHSRDEEGNPVYTTKKVEAAYATLTNPDSSAQAKEYARDLLRERQWIEAAATDAQWTERGGKPLDQDGFQTALKALVDMKWKMSREVPVAIKDNTVTFGTEEQRDKLYTWLRTKEEIPNDANILSRVGTIINRESNDPLGKANEFVVPAGTRLHANDVDPNLPARTSMDGVLYKLPGMRLQQGTLYTDDGRAAKGAGGNPLRVRGPNYKEDDKGNPIFPEERDKMGTPWTRGRNKKQYTSAPTPTGEREYFAPDGTRAWTEEATSFTASFELGRKGPGETVTTEPQNVKFYPMNNVDPERAGAMPNQGVMFNLKNPVATFRRNRAENLRHKAALEIAGDPRRQKLFEMGVPLGLLLHPEDIISMVRSVLAPSSRAFAVPSALVEKGQIMLSPAAFKRLNRVLKESGHEGLVAGVTKLNLDRQPSMSDGSGFSGYTFAGIAEATNPEDANVEFVITNNADYTLVQKGLDFDGDRVNIYGEQEWLTPRGMDTTPEPNYQAKGVKPVDGTDDEKAAAKAAAAKSPIPELQNDPDFLTRRVKVTEDDGTIVERDALANALINSDLGFSQMIGLIMRTAQNLAEMGKLGDPVKTKTVTGVGSDGKPITESIQTTFSQIAKAVGNASIDAKKKKAFAKEALEAFDQLKKKAQDERPIKRLADGTKVETGKKDRNNKPIYERERTFTTWISRVQKAPVSLNQGTGEGSEERIQRQLTQAYLQKILTEEEITHPRAIEAVLAKDSPRSKRVSELKPGSINILNPQTKLDNIYAASLQADRLVTRHANAVSALMRAANSQQSKAVYAIVQEAYRVRDAIKEMDPEFARKFNAAWQSQYEHLLIQGVDPSTELSETGTLTNKNPHLGVSLEVVEFAEELLAEYNTLLNLDVTLPMTSTQMRTAYEDQSALMQERNVPGASMNMTRPINIAELWEANLGVGVAPEMAALAEDLYANTGGRISALLSDETREAFGDTLEVPMHTELAYQVLELKRKAVETKAFETPKLPPLVMDAAEEMLYKDGEMAPGDVSMLQDLSADHRILSKEIRELNSEQDSELFEELTAQRAEIATDIKIMYYTGRATAAGLIALAPTHLALRTVHTEKFDEIIQRAGTPKSFRMRLNSLDSQGKTIAPQTVRSGIYKLVKNKLVLQTFKADEKGNFDPNTATPHEDDVVLAPQFTMTYGKDEVAPHAKLENDRLSALYADASRVGGFVRVSEIDHATMSLVARMEAVNPNEWNAEMLSNSKDLSMPYHYSIAGGGEKNQDFDILANGVIPKGYELKREWAGAKNKDREKTAWKKNIKEGQVVRLSPTASSNSKTGYLFFRVTSVRRTGTHIYVGVGGIDAQNFVFYPGERTNENIPHASAWGLAVHQYKQSRIKLFNALNAAWAKGRKIDIPPEVGVIPAERQERFRTYMAGMYKETSERWQKDMGDVPLSQIRKYSKTRFAQYAPLKFLGTTAEWEDISEAYREFIIARNAVDDARATGGAMAVPRDWKERRPLNSEGPDTRIPDEETFLAWEEKLRRQDINLTEENRRKLQNVADGVSRMFSASSAEVVNASKYHAILLADGQKADAEKVREGKLRGSYWRSPRDGSIYIYVAAPPGRVLGQQMATLVHELGHHLVLDQWAKLHQNRPEVTEAVWNEFLNYAATKKGFDVTGKDPERTGAMMLEFHEWIADNIGAWVSADLEVQKEVNTVADGVFEMLAEVLSTFYSYLHRTFTAQGQPRAIEDSVDGFMRALRESVRDQTSQPEMQEKVVSKKVKEADQKRRTTTTPSKHMPPAEEVEKTVDKSPVPATGMWRGRSEPDALEQAYIASLAAKAKAAAVSVNSSREDTIHDLKTIAEGTLRALETLVTPKDLDMLRRIVQQPDMRKRLSNLVGRGTEQARRMEYEPDLAVMYLYVFTRAKLMTAPNKISENSVLNTLDSIVRRQSRQIQDATAEEVQTIIDRLQGRHFDSTTPLLDEHSPGYRLYKNRQDRYLKGLNGGLQRVRDLYRQMTSWYVDVPYQRVLDFQRPTLIAALRRAQPMAWELGGTKGTGYVEMKQVEFQTAAQHSHELIAGLTEDQQAEARLVLFNTPNVKASAPAKAAADKLRGVLNYLHQREAAAGLPVEKRQNYWPMIIAHNHTLENLDSAVKTFTKTAGFKKGWETVKAQYLEWMNKELAVMRPGSPDYNSQQGAIAKVQSMTQNQFVAHYLQEDAHRGLPNTAIKRHPSTIAHTPGFRFMNPRVLNFLLESNDANIHAEVMQYLETNMFDVAKRYIKASAQRTAWQKFLTDIHPSGTLAGLLAEAQMRDGATAEELDVFVRSLDAMNGMLGLKERDVMNGIFDAAGKDSWLQNFKAEPGELMNERINAGRQFVHMWTNITKLTTTAAAASVDPFGQLLRHGSGKIFAQSTKQAHDMLRTIARNGGLDELQKFLVGTGLMEHAMTVEDHAETYDGAQVEQPGGSNTLSGKIVKGTRTAQNKFFYLNGVEFITVRARAAAGFSAVDSIIKWSREAKSEDKVIREIAQQRLADLDLSAEDVEVAEYKTNEGEKGELIKYLTFDERMKLQDDASNGDESAQERLDRDDRIRVAVHRQTNESTLRPDSTNRSLSASNPYYSIFNVWKGYITAYHNQILRPAWARLLEENNATPLMWMALTFIPIMLFADMLRDAIKTGLDQDEDDFRPRWKDDWTFGDHVLYAAERAGFLGKNELVLDIMQPLAEGNVPRAFGEIAGVPVSDVMKMGKYGPGAENLPGGDLWKNWG